MFGFGKKQRRPTEKKASRAIEEQAGRLLCTVAGLAYRRDTAAYLAGVIQEIRWYELSEKTGHRLRSLPAEVLDGLASDIRD